MVGGASAFAVVFLVAASSAFELKNSAVVFLKPHAATDACEAFVRDHLAAAGVSVIDAGTKSAAMIEERKLIDAHYGSLARIAMELEPAELALSDKARADFASTYGVEWSAALGQMLRNDVAMERLGVDGQALEPMWRSGEQLKLAPGTYVSRLVGTSEPVYTLNGFYPAMRQSFVEPGAAVRYFVCEWDEAALSWAAFRRDVIGATNPADAAAGSARAELLERWASLGLACGPSYGQNGVHASAGPLEGLKERLVWAGGSLETDAFAQALLGAGGLRRDTLEAWLADNSVVTLGGSTDKVFDLTEELGSDAVLALVTDDGEAPPSDAPGAESGAAVVGAAPAGFAWGGTF